MFQDDKLYNLTVQQFSDNSLPNIIRCNHVASLT